MKLQNDTFSTGQVAAAAEIAPNTLQTYIKRGMIVGQSGDGVHMPGSQAVRRSYSFFNVMEVALAAPLIKTGVPVSLAFRIGADFAHSGDGERAPGFPYYGPAETVIFLAGERFQFVEVEDYNAVLDRVLADFQYPEVITVLRVNPIFERVALKLGYHPEKTREEAHNLFGRDDQPAGYAED